MNKTKDEFPSASAATFGAAIRKALKSLGLDWKVKCKTVSFGGFGHGDMPFADVQTERRLTYVECSVLADSVREVRNREGGGKGVVNLCGRDYAFGGYIGHKDYPSGVEFWKQVGTNMAPTSVMEEAEVRADIAYDVGLVSADRRAWTRNWIAYGAANPEAWAEYWPLVHTGRFPV